MWRTPTPEEVSLQILIDEDYIVTLENQRNYLLAAKLQVPLNAYYLAIEVEGPDDALTDKIFLMHLSKDNKADQYLTKTPLLDSKHEIKHEFYFIFERTFKFENSSPKYLIEAFNGMLQTRNHTIPMNYYEVITLFRRKAIFKYFEGVNVLKKVKEYLQNTDKQNFRIYIVGDFSLPELACLTIDQNLKSEGYCYDYDVEGESRIYLFLW